MTVLSWALLTLTAEQQLYKTEAVQNAFAPSHFTLFGVRSTARGYCEISMCPTVVKDTGEKLVER